MDKTLKATRPSEETRLITSPVELRKAEDGAIKIRGHAAVYDKRSENLGGFVEVIEPGFFDKVLDNDVRGLFNHDDNQLLGRTASGTMRIGTDEEGLTYEIDLPDTSVGRDLATLIERGDVTQSSFAFTVSREGAVWDEDENGVVVRTLLKNGCQRLYDCSPVTYPAYPDTDVARKSLRAFRCDAGLEEARILHAQTLHRYTGFIALPDGER